VIGRDFEDTASTIGIGKFTCDIKYAQVGGGGWSEYQKPHKEMEAAVASMIANGYEQKETEMKPVAAPVARRGEPNAYRAAADEQAQLKTKLSSMSGANKASQVHAQSTPAHSSSARGAVSAPAASVPADLAKYMDESSQGAADEEDLPPPISSEEAKRFDNDLVMKCLADKIQTDSKFVISVFDFGGQSVFNVRTCRIENNLIY
jgi:hypothetical protein